MAGQPFCGVDGEPSGRGDELNTCGDELKGRGDELNGQGEERESNGRGERWVGERLSSSLPLALPSMGMTDRWPGDSGQRWAPSDTARASM